MTTELEGTTKKCTKCNTDLIYVKVISEWQGQKKEKLQWQNLEDGKPHFTYVSEKNYKCRPPAEQKTIDPPKTILEKSLTIIDVDKEIKTLSQIENIVKSTLGDVPDAKIGMYVKEIYRQAKLAENKQ